MLDRLDRHEAEYRRRMAGATLAAVAFYAALFLLLGGPRWIAFWDEDQRLHLGYPGLDRSQPELEVYEPNSVQDYFHQKAREGRTRALEYRIVQPLDVSPGPQPLATPREERQPEAQPALGTEDLPDVVEALPATHAPLSFSEDFQIVRLVKPTYPEYELSQRIRARILVIVWVTADGDLESEQIQESRTDPPDASPRGFELATLEAVRQWKVKPPRQLQGSQGIWLTIPVEFDPEKPAFIDVPGIHSR